MVTSITENQSVSDMVLQLAFFRIKEQAKEILSLGNVKHEGMYVYLLVKYTALEYTKNQNEKKTVIGTKEIPVICRDILFMYFVLHLNCQRIAEITTKPIHFVKDLVDQDFTDKQSFLKEIEKISIPN